VMESTLNVQGGGPLTAEMAATVAASGRGRGGPGGGRGGAGGPGAPAGVEMGDAPGGAGGGRGRGNGAAGRGQGAPGDAAGGRGGRGGGRGAGSPNGWRVRQVPLGTGMDDLPQFAAVLKEINFHGPIEVQAEYPNGGAESAQDKITLPREQVLGAMKRDRLALCQAFAASGLL